jgi:precorrin-4 methylase
VERPRRQVNLASVVAGVDIAALDDDAAKKVGELLCANGTSDHVALLVRPKDRVLTSDEDDIKALLRTRRVTMRLDTGASGRGRSVFTRR